MTPLCPKSGPPGAPNPAFHRPGVLRKIHHPATRPAPAKLPARILSGKLHNWGGQRKYELQSRPHSGMVDREHFYDAA
jgi:hypothetical protein